MTESIDIASGERDVVRVFAIDVPPEAVEAFTTRDADGRWPLKDALNADTLDPDRVEVFSTADLSGLGLSGYLAQGMGIADADLTPQRARLDALTGHVAVIGSSAFEGQEQTLRPQPPVRLVASFREQAPEPAGPPLRSESAEGAAPPPIAPLPGTARDLPRGTISALVLGALILAAVLFWALA